MTWCQTVILMLFTWARSVLQLLTSPLWEQGAVLPLFPPHPMIDCLTSWEVEEKAPGKGKTVIPCDVRDKVMDAAGARHFSMFVSNKFGLLVAACWINAESCAA